MYIITLKQFIKRSVTATLPSWALASLSTYTSKTYNTDEEMMSLAIELSNRNILEGTGGPFGCAIFERLSDDDSTSSSADKGSYCKLVSIGMNRVVPLNNSTLHGEMVAIQLAQQKIGSFTLMVDKEENDICTKVDDDRGDSKDETPKKKRQFELFTSCEPCAMCLGATLWSGVSRIVCGATKDDAQSIGFDEGPVYTSSYTHLEGCGVAVTKNVLREKAADVLRRYGSSGLIYNRD